MITRGRQLLGEYDQKMASSGDFSLTEEANDKLCAMAKECSDDVLGNVLREASLLMKNGYSRADN